MTTISRTLRHLGKVLELRIGFGAPQQHLPTKVTTANGWFPPYNHADTRVANRFSDNEPTGRDLTLLIL